MQDFSGVSDLSNEYRDVIWSSNVRSRSDLYSFSNKGISSWNDLTDSFASVLQPLQVGNPPAVPVPLRPLQYWIPSPDSSMTKDTIVEILGLEGEMNINFRKHLNNNRGKIRGTTTTMDKPRDLLSGGASSHSMPYPLALGSSPRRVLALPPTSTKGLTVKLITEPTVVAMNSQQELAEPFPISLTRILEMGPFIVFSDGSWQQSGSAWKHVLSNAPEFCGYIGLIFMSSLPNWRENPIYSLRIINGEGLQASSAFSMELFGIMVAAAIFAHCPDSTTIFSGCEAATKSIHSQLQSRQRIRTSTGDASKLVLAAKLIQEKGTQVQ